MSKRVESVDGDKETIKLLPFNSSELTLTKQDAQILLMELDEALRAITRIQELKHAGDLRRMMQSAQQNSNLIKPA